VTFAPDSWQPSTSAADVRIGENRFSGDLRTYQIQATVEEITVDITPVGQVPAWRALRPATCSTAPAARYGTRSRSFTVSSESRRGMRLGR
jgi:hypothetical protein